MKFFKKAILAIAAVATLVCSTPPMMIKAADDYDLTLTTDINKSLEIPLTLDASTDDFYINANINPGDVMKADVIFKNVSKEDIQVRIADVINQLENTLSVKLLEVLDLTIEIDGSVVYKGSHDAVTSPLTQWVTLKPGNNLTMKITVEFPKYEADNTYQAAEMKVKYVFEARADVPPDDSTSTTTTTTSKTPNTETVKTGADDTESSNVSTYIMLGCGIFMLISYVVAKKIVEKKKEENRK